jgi:hydroxymethylpyrimidine pyrophosphatase-like HAD family hydrolase
VDKYLQPNSSYKRLCEEYEKYGSLIICCDFDDTIYDFHKVGNSYELVKQLVRDLKDIGCYIIIWTGNQNTEFVTNYLLENNIPFDSINDEAPVSKKLLGESIPRKVYGNVYIDDRAGLYQVYTELSNLVNKYKNANN